MAFNANITLEKQIKFVKRYKTIFEVISEIEYKNLKTDNSVRLIAEKAREIVGYSPNTYRVDIASALIDVYKNLGYDSTVSEIKPEPYNDLRFSIIIDVYPKGLKVKHTNIKSGKTITVMEVLGVLEYAKGAAMNAQQKVNQFVDINRRVSILEKEVNDGK